MNDIQLADKIASMLEQTDSRVAITPYDRTGLQFIVDYNPDLSEGYLVSVEQYEGA